MLFLLIGQRTTPSVVAFAEDGTRHVGDVAKRQVSRNSAFILLSAAEEVLYRERTF